MVARDPSMQAVITLADQVAASDASILITGESGVGKEVMARYVHQKSRRAARPFICVNCAAIPENLLESELFGHEKGAFTGAVARRIGKFEEANGGTLLLDEISEMDGRLQAKLLRALQEREIDRVGGAKPVKVDIRILATSNRDLAQAVQGRHLPRGPALSPERREPAPAAAARAAGRRRWPWPSTSCKKYAAANGVPERPLSAEARRRLVGHRWPGNVRELENAMHRAVLLSIGAGDRGVRHPPAGRPAAVAPADPHARAAQRRLDGRRGRQPRLRRPDRGGDGAAADHRHPEPLPRQPHPRGQHPGHLDPHPAQQAEGIHRGRRRRCPRPQGAKRGLSAASGPRSSGLRPAQCAEAAIGPRRAGSHRRCADPMTRRWLTLGHSLAATARPPTAARRAGAGWRVARWRLALGVVGIIVLLILPIPAFLLDLLLALSITSAVLILMTSLLIKKPLEFTAFPTVLLVTTLFRLGAEHRLDPPDPRPRPRGHRRRRPHHRGLRQADDAAATSSSA